jgi:hypothetical protein
VTLHSYQTVWWQCRKKVFFKWLQTAYNSWSWSSVQQGQTTETQAKLNSEEQENSPCHNKHVTCRTAITLSKLQAHCLTTYFLLSAVCNYLFQIFSPLLWTVEYLHQIQMASCAVLGETEYRVCSPKFSNIKTWQNLNHTIFVQSKCNQTYYIPEQSSSSLDRNYLKTEWASTLHDVPESSPCKFGFMCA